jgi:hypothetical protein
MYSTLRSEGTELYELFAVAYGYYIRWLSSFGHFCFIELLSYHFSMLQQQP